MTSPLDLAGVAPTLIIVWVCAGLVPLGALAFPPKDRRRLSARPRLFALLQWISWGCMFTINGIAQAAYDRGLITFGLEIFTILTAALAMVFAVAIGRLQARTKVANERPDSAD